MDQLSMKYNDVNCDSLLNLTILDPPKYGWTVLGGIQNVCPPHENARRESTRVEYLATMERSKQLHHQEKELPARTIAEEHAPIEPEDKDNYKIITSHENVEQKEGILSDVVEKKQLPSPPVPSKVKDVRYDFGPQYSVNVRVSSKAKGKRKPATKVTIQVHPFVRNIDPQSEEDPKVDSDVTLHNCEDSPVESVVSPEDDLKLKSLHPRAYHRGIEGEEPRNKTTGVLYQDVGSTDTNHGWDILPSECVVPVKIEFPLVDDYHDVRVTKPSDALSQIEKNESKHELMDEEIPMFCEIVKWDLSNPETPTPLVYAADVAAEFGLSFTKTLDLARSIQNQIDDFMRDYVIYHVPISARDPYEIARSKDGLQPVKYKFGVRMHGGHCASDVATKHRLFDGVDRFTHVVLDAKEELMTSSRDERSDRRKKGNKDVQSKKKTSNMTLPKVYAGKYDMNSFDVDPKYAKEFFRRAKEENRLIIKTLVDKGHDMDVSLGTRNCHICRNSKDDCIQFPCGLKSHSLCGAHISRLPCIKTVDKSERHQFDYCPICSIQCTCKNCSLKAKELVLFFTKECHMQNLEPQDVNFDFIQNCNKAFSNIVNKALQSDGIVRPLYKSNESKRSHKTLNAAPNQKQMQKKMEIMRPVRMKTEEVPKISSDEFPNELLGDINLDPSLEDDYFTVFTPFGHTLIESKNKEVELEIEPKVQADTEQVELEIEPKVQVDTEQVELEVERKVQVGTEQEELEVEPKVQVDDEQENKLTSVVDGNIDYCLKCKDMGKLILCDKCPRAFHSKCLHLDEENLPTNWICPCCRSDCEEQESDVKDGMSVKDMLLNVYKNFSDEHDFQNKVTIISQLYEIVLALCDADFGYIFKEPVKVKGYKKIVKRPMDLNTIATRIILGKFTNDPLLQESGSASKMDVIILLILRDLEQIWWNCFLFNRPDSKYYRMAQVMRARCGVLKCVNIDSKISEYVKKEYESFVQMSESNLRAIPVIEIIDKRWLPPSKHKIVFDRTKIKGKKKPVGIFDPDTNMIVKQYSSFTSAAKVYDFLVSQGHKSGINLTSSILLRHQVILSPNDPSIKVFGYRWMYMEDIRNGSFKINSDHDKKSSLKTLDDNASEDQTMVFDSFSVINTNIHPSEDQTMDFLSKSDDDHFSSKKRSLGDFESSPSKRERLSKNSLCENVQYSPFVQDQALHAARQISVSSRGDYEEDKILAIDMSSISNTDEYQNIADAATALNLSKDGLEGLIKKRETIDNKLYIFEAEKEKIIEAMRTSIHAD